MTNVVLKKNPTFPAARPIAMHFEAPPVALAEKSVVIVARTTGEAFQGYWGRCVHDFAGYIPPAKPIVIDYAHDDAKPIGVCDSVAIEGDELIARGRIIPFTADDQASQVIFQGSKGIPFQASINMSLSNLVEEEVPEGTTVDVNGGTFTGPGYVFRKWSLDGVAILAYGSDAETSVQFNRHGSAAIPRSEGKKFLAAFGTKGVEWLLEGKSFGEAAKLDAAEKDAEIEALKAEIERLKAELEAAKATGTKQTTTAGFHRGQVKTVPAQGIPKSFGSGPAARSEFERVKSGRSKNYQAFVEGIASRMPGAKQ